MSRLTADDWPLFRQARLAALTEAPRSFGSTAAQERTFTEAQWREALDRGATFVALDSGRQPVGIVAGIPRDPPGLGAMWIAPPWRGSGLATRLLEAVVDWARTSGSDRLTLWAATDDRRACRFYEREGFHATGVSRPFPGSADRLVQEMLRTLS